MARRRPKPLAPAANLSGVIRQINQGVDPVTAVALFAKHVKGREDAAWASRGEWDGRDSEIARRQASVAYGKTEAFAELLGNQDDLRSTLTALAVPGFETL